MVTLIPNGRSNPAPTDSRYLQILHHTIMFLVWTLNIILYRYDSFLFNYHSTIINQLFNYHFGRFTRNRHTPKALKTECFVESISLFSGTRYFFVRKTLDLFLKIPISGPFTPPSERSWDPGLQTSDTRVSTKKCNYIAENMLYVTCEKVIVFMMVW